MYFASLDIDENELMRLIVYKLLNLSDFTLVLRDELARDILEFLLIVWFEYRHMSREAPHLQRDRVEVLDQQEDRESIVAPVIDQI